MTRERPPDPPTAAPAQEQARAGLCASCTHADVTRNRRGAAFWRCGRSDADPRFQRYPALPVRSCPGHAPRRC